MNYLNLLARENYLMNERKRLLKKKEHLNGLESSPAYEQVINDLKKNQSYLIANRTNQRRLQR